MYRKFAILLTLLVAMPMLASRPRIPSPDSLAALRAEVWNSWRQAWAASERTTSLPSLAPLSEARVTAWLLPDSLEPRALLRFRSGTKGTRPSSGWPCYVYLHGSGPREGEWQAGYAMAQRFDDAPSAYFIPQIPQEGAYYRWWQRSKQWAWHRLLRHLLASPEINARINAIVHPAVADDFAASGKQWLESAILFESGFDRRIAFDYIVCVTAPRPVRIQRIVQRDNITPQRAAEWIDVQMNQQEVAQHSDFCIQNDGESDLQAQIDDILRQIAINN